MIKLPVRMVEIGCGEAFVTDDAGVTHNLSDRELAAALNAAPTRAFEELTAGAIAQMRSEICEALGEYPSEGSADDQAAWLAKADAAFLSRLQAFTAPVIPEGWRLVPVDLLSFEIDRYHEMEMKAIALSQRQCDRARPGFGADAVTVLEEAEELLKAGLASVAQPAPLRTEAEVRAEAKREVLEDAAKAAYGAGAYRVDAKTGKVTPLNHADADVTAAAIRALIEKEPES